MSDTLGSDILILVQHGGYSEEEVAACEKVLGALGVWDALMGCNGKVVFTAEDVERAAKEARLASRKESGFRAGLPWEKLDGSVRDEWLAVARTAITAAGGVVVDHSYDCGQFSAAIQREDGGLVLLDAGDKVYIVDAKGK